MPIDYWSITLTAIFTGIGVAIGNEVYDLIRRHRQKYVEEKLFEKLKAVVKK